MRYPMFIFAILALLATVNTPGHAAVQNEPVARIAAMRHQATAINLKGEKRPLKVRATIFKGDTIQTGKKGRLQILFSDNTIISLGRQTTFVIQEYLWQPDKQDGEFRSEVKEGIFRVMGGKLTKTAPQKFTTKTPAATIGIRGSMYAGVVTGNSLSVVFQGGLGIVVTNKFGSVEIPKPGYGTHVRANTKPTPPTSFSGEAIKTFSTSLTDADSITDSEEPDTTSSLEDQSEEESIIISENPELPSPVETTGFLDTTALWTPPTDGVTMFHGAIGGVSTRFSDGSQESISEPADIFANWHNHKVLGIVYDPEQEKGMPVFFFGDIDGSQVYNVKIFGNTVPDSLDTNPEPISVVEGTGTGGFLGTDTGIFYMQGSGYDYEVEPPSQPALGSWAVEGVGMEVAFETADYGSETWQAHAVGISENMADIDTNRRLLTSGSGGFSLAVDKDSGTVTGTLSVSDGAFSLDNISVGGSNGSAYIFEDLFTAILGGGSIPLKPHGNFLVTGPKDKLFMEYGTWGYWEVAYSDGGNEYHNHVPGAMWVAGNPTSTADLAALASNSVTGTYSGQVLASKIDTAASMQVSDLGGSLNMNVAFANLGSTGSISGEMALDGKSFAIDSNGSAGNPTFNGSLGDGTFSGVINGTFYGPAAGSVGGNFKTSGGTVTYQGIYGGNR